MLNIKTLSTGSSGNCYLLSTEDETLILDCGLPIKEIKKGLNFDISKVAGVLCTHEHADHNKALEDLRNMGMRIHAPFCVGNVKSSRIRMGSFNVTSFDLPHNGTWNSGFLIKVNGQKILYMTDFEYCQYNFRKLKVNHILIECNYQKELVSKDLPNYEHKIRGHASLDTCKGFIEANATDDLRTVLLLHMGSDTCNPEECVSEVQKVAGNAIVDYARKGLEIELRESWCPF